MPWSIWVSYRDERYSYIELHVQYILELYLYVLYSMCTGTSPEIALSADLLKTEWVWEGEQKRERQGWVAAYGIPTFRPAFWPFGLQGKAEEMTVFSPWDGAKVQEGKGSYGSCTLKYLYVPLCMQM